MLNPVVFKRNLEVYPFINLLIAPFHAYIDAMPSTDVDMMDPATQYTARPEPSSSARTTPAHLSSHVTIRDPRRVDAATSFIQRHWNPGETPGKFSKFEREIQGP
jgi:hypothetical protein